MNYEEMVSKLQSRNDLRSKSISEIELVQKTGVMFKYWELRSMRIEQELDKRILAKLVLQNSQIIRLAELIDDFHGFPGEVLSDKGVI